MLNCPYRITHVVESVENGYHALAIDDERRTFHPTLWDAQLEEYQNVR